MNDQIARYSPSKIRARAEEKLGWAPGSSRDISFNALREMLKARFPKLAHEIRCMLDAGDHLLEEEPDGAAEDRTRRFEEWERAAADDEVSRLGLALADTPLPAADRQVLECSLAKAKSRSKRPS